jgi:hypothetical protein
MATNLRNAEKRAVKKIISEKTFPPQKIICIISKIVLFLPRSSLLKK